MIGGVGAVAVVAIVTVLVLMATLGAAAKPTARGQNTSSLPTTTNPGNSGTETPPTTIGLNGSAPTIPAPPSLLSALGGVTPVQFAAAGVAQAGPNVTGVIAGIRAKPLTQDGKPEIVYYGSGYCPFCAAFRWPFAVALLRFGRFINLDQSASSPWDSYPSTPTLNFGNGFYVSRYIALSTVELQSNVCADLQGNECDGYVTSESPTATAVHLAETYDVPKYFPGDGGGSGGWIPFVYWAGRYAEVGGLYSPAVLSGNSPAEVGADLSQPMSPAGQAILEVANIYTAIICGVDGEKPGAVCDTPVIRAATAYLPKS